MFVPNNGSLSLISYANGDDFVVVITLTNATRSYRFDTVNDTGNDVLPDLLWVMLQPSRLGIVLKMLHLKEG